MGNRRRTTMRSRKRRWIRMRPEKEGEGEGEGRGGGERGDSQMLQGTVSIPIC